MAAKYWTCRKCGYRNERRWLYCRGTVLASGTTYGPCTGSKRPPKHVPTHAIALRDHPYADYLVLNGVIHGAGAECACCGREPKDTRHMDRDHGHDKTEITYGKPRGLLCPGDWGCNRMMSRLTLERARAVVAYLERAEAYWRTQAALER